jgi:carbon dioxide concentrating mechanism protein CcmN
MYSPPLQPLCNRESYVSGDVTIDPSAVIGTGVLLAAEPNSRIVIGAGVCIGMGTIIHAQQGSLEVEAGAILGAGVLVIGAGKIGTNACVGSCTTVLYSSVESRQVVPPNSLIGDESRQTVNVTTTEVTSEVKTETKTESSIPPPPKSNNLSVDSEPLEPQETNKESPIPEVTTQHQPQPTQLEVEVPTNAAVQVYGQVHLNRLMLTLFPHNQSLKPPNQDGKVD